MRRRLAPHWLEPLERHQNKWFGGFPLAIKGDKEWYENFGTQLTGAGPECGEGATCGLDNDRKVTQYLIRQRRVFTQQKQSHCTELSWQIAFMSSSSWQSIQQRRRKYVLDGKVFEKEKDGRDLIDDERSIGTNYCSCNVIQFYWRH